MRAANFTGRVAVITGASSGIGAATAVAFGTLGMRVALAARDETRLASTANRVRAAGGEAMVIPTDITDRARVEDMVGRALERWGRVDILLANAGQYIRRPVADLTVEAFERSMQVNFYGALYATVAVLPHMLQRGSGHVILMSTLDGKKGIPPDAPYAAAKHALTGFGDVARQELASHGVRVTTVLPGRVQTPMIEGLHFHRVSRPVPPERVARAIVRAVRRPSAEVVVPGHARAIVWAHTLSPRLTDRAVRSLRLEGWRED